jgi:hypothetical protein
MARYRVPNGLLVWIAFVCGRRGQSIPSGPCLLLRSYRHLREQRRAGVAAVKIGPQAYAGPGLRMSLLPLLALIAFVIPVGAFALRPRKKWDPQGKVCASRADDSIWSLTLMPSTAM